MAAVVSFKKAALRFYTFHPIGCESGVHALSYMQVPAASQLAAALVHFALQGPTGERAKWDQLLATYSLVDNSVAGIDGVFSDRELHIPTTTTDDLCQ